MIVTKLRNTTSQTDMYLNDEKAKDELDRLRAHYLGISYETFVVRKAELEHQAQMIRKDESVKPQHRS